MDGLRDMEGPTLTRNRGRLDDGQDEKEDGRVGERVRILKIIRCSLNWGLPPPDVSHFKPE